MNQSSFILVPKQKDIVDANGNKILLNEGEVMSVQLNNAFSSVKNITAACFSISETYLVEPPQELDWYPGIKKKFDSVTDYAEKWLYDYAIEVTSTIPSSIKTFQPTYQYIAGKIINLVEQKGGSNLTPEDREVIGHYMGKLLSEVNEISQTVNQYVNKNAKTESDKGILINWQKDMHFSTKELMSGNENVQKAAVSLSGDILTMKNEITTLQKNVEMYNKMVSAGGGMVGGGAFIATVGGAVCLAMPLAGGIVLTVGIGSLIAGSTVWGVYQGKINDSYKKIESLKQKIGTTEKLLTVVNSMSGSCSSVIEYANTATECLGSFGDSWRTLEVSLDTTMKYLRSSEESVWKSAAPDIMDLEISMEHWKTVSDYADQLLAVSPDVKKVGIEELMTVA